MADVLCMRHRHADSVVVSGPRRDRSVSLDLIRSDDLEERGQIAAGDPFIAEGKCRFEIIEWEIHQILGIGDFTAP